MAWEWSHTPEAYSDAYENLGKLPHGELAVIWAEWRAWDGNSFAPQLKRGYKSRLREAKRLPADILADSIWEKAEELRTCENGGWDAWVCPFGCHTVPFSCESED